MALTDEIITIVRDTLMLGDRADSFDASTQLLGGIPEFDSMAVVSLLTAIEDEYGCVFEDDEINAEVFSTIGSLTEFVETKI